MEAAFFETKHSRECFHIMARQKSQPELRGPPHRPTDVPSRFRQDKPHSHGHERRADSDAVQRPLPARFNRRNRLAIDRVQVTFSAGRSVAALARGSVSRSTSADRNDMILSELVFLAERQFSPTRFMERLQPLTRAHRDHEPVATIESVEIGDWSGVVWSGDPKTGGFRRRAFCGLGICQARVAQTVSHMPSTIGQARVALRSSVSWIVARTQRKREET
jgi:hypothetical protein